jgi:hypothetical protein
LDNSSWVKLVAVPIALVSMTGDSPVTVTAEVPRTEIGTSREKPPTKGNCGRARRASGFDHKSMSRTRGTTRQQWF